MRIQHAPPRRHLIDFDGTITNYPTHAVISFRSMMHIIMEATGHNEPVVKAAMSRHYSKGGFENPFLEQSLEREGFLDEMEIGMSAFRRRLRRAFNASKTKNLMPYAGIPDVMRDAIAQQDEVIVLTDANDLATLSKLQAYHTQFLGPEHITRIIAHDNSPRFHPSVSQEFIQRERERLLALARVPVTVTSVAKPDSDLEDILGLSLAEIQDTVDMTGDSYHKDMGLALRYGMQGYFALWGVRDLEENQDEIMQFVGGASPIQPAYRPQSYPTNIHPVEEPVGLREHWRLQQAA